jgi:hypothetical protein
MAKAVIQTGITADVSGFKRGIMEAEMGAKRFANGQIKQLGGMIGGAFAARAVINFAKQTGDAARTVQDMAGALSVTGQEYQTLALLAKRGGSSAEAMTNVLKRAAIEGVKFEDVAKVMRGATVEGVSTELALRVMGKTGAELNNVLDMIANEGLVNLQNELLRTGQIMTEETVNAAAAMDIAFEKSFTSIGNKIAEWSVKGISAIKRYYAFVGAIAGGAGISEAMDISKQSVKEELGPSAQAANQNRVTRQDLTKGAKGPASLGLTVTASDSLAKIGGIVGGQTSPMQSIAERQLKIAERTETTLQKIAENTNAAAKAGQELVEGD